MSEYEKAVKAGVDLFITGDIKYHNASDALEEDVCLMDITHYGSEVLIMHKVLDYLAENEPDAEFIMSEINNQPFSVI
jgi:putative NIF3 family GTP cyclohydrolase 1 type 2